MNFYIWEFPGFYAPGYIIYVSNSLDELLDLLKSNKDYNWHIIQGIETRECGYSFKEYVTANIDQYKDELEAYRSEVLSNQHQKIPIGEICCNWHKSASLQDLLETNHYRMDRKKFVDQNIVENKSPWFIDPKEQSLEKGIYIPTVD